MVDGRPLLRHKIVIGRLVQYIQPLRWCARRLPVSWCFRWVRAEIALAYLLNPHAARLAKPLADMLEGHEERQRIRERGRDYLLYRRWQNLLEKSWRHWAWKHERFVRIEGDDTLVHALERGGGAILLSGHYYGYDRMVDPILAQRGFAITRWAAALDPPSTAERWGESVAPWNAINFHGDGWHATRMIFKVREELQRNRAIHLSVLGHARGESAFRLNFEPKEFFLDPKIFELLEILRAPVLPCFAMPEAAGKIVIRIYPPIVPVKDEIMGAFGALYSKYLNEHPEFTRIWRRVMRGEERW